MQRNAIGTAVALAALTLAGSTLAGDMSSLRAPASPALGAQRTMPSAIRFPKCPALFKVAHQGTYKFVCEAHPPMNKAGEYVLKAGLTKCGAAWWNFRDVEQAGSIFAPVVRWTCKHI